MSEGTVEDPVLGHRLSFERITDEKGGQALRVEIWVDRSGGVPPHVHPGMEERFEVLAGTDSSAAASGRAPVPGRSS